MSTPSRPCPFGCDPHGNMKHFPLVHPRGLYVVVKDGTDTDTGEPVKIIFYDYEFDCTDLLKIGETEQCKRPREMVPIPFFDLLYPHLRKRDFYCKASTRAASKRKAKRARRLRKTFPEDLVGAQ